MLRTWQSRLCATNPWGRGKADHAPLNLGTLQSRSCTPNLRGRGKADSAPLTLGDVAKPAWAPTQVKNRKCQNNSLAKVHPAAGTIATS